MKFEFYIKEGEIYKKISIVPIEGSGWEYFQSLRLSLERELETIKIDLLKLCGNVEKVNLGIPRSDNKDIQEKIDKLVIIRRENMTTRENLMKLLNSPEFIICDRCGGKMTKIPVGVKYEKFGNKYIIKEDILHTSIKYIYGCEDCIMAINEENYYEKMRNIKLRKTLLDNGIGFVPNEFGFYYWDKSISYKHTEETECDHSWKREFEEIKMQNIKNPFLKITEKCGKCGKIQYIR
jgi:hypothetical protein